MPLPTPKPQETKEEFINRCMDDDVMVRDYASEEQRAGVCFTQWRNAGKAEDGLHAVIATKDEARRIVTAPVLVPGEKDADGEAVTKEHIADVAEYWMEHYRIVDKGHTLQAAAVPIESWITRSDHSFKTVDGGKLDIPAGSWMMSVKINEPTDWAKVQNGQFRGFSVMAVPGQAHKSAAGDTALKKTLLKDLGNTPGAERWIVTAVSLVDEPSVPKSRWVAMKSAKRSLFDRLLGGVSGKSPDETDKGFKPLASKDKEDEEMDEETIKQYTKEAVKEMQAAENQASVEDRLDKLEKQLAGAADDSDKTGKTDKPDKTGSGEGGEDKSGKDKTDKPDKTGSGEGSETADKGLDALKQRLTNEKLKLADLYDSEDKDRDEKIEAQKRKVKVLEELVGEGSGEGGDKGKSGKGEDAELPPEVSKRLEELEKKLTTKARGLSGHDGASDGAATKGEDDDPFPRDAMGRRIYKS